MVSECCPLFSSRSIMTQCLLFYSHDSHLHQSSDTFMNQFRFICYKVFNHLFLTIFFFFYKLYKIIKTLSFKLTSVILKQNLTSLLYKKKTFKATDFLFFFGSSNFRKENGEIPVLFLVTCFGKLSRLFPLFHHQSKQKLPVISLPANWCERLTPNFSF